VPETERLKRFLEAYEGYVQNVLKPTQLEIREELAAWQRPDHWEKYKRTNRIPIPTPVRTLFSRIKRPEQVVDKIYRKPDRFPAGLEVVSFRSMHDALGVRIVVYFLSHLPLIDRELRASDRFEISAAESPTAYMRASQVKLLSLDHLRAEEKESGYAAIHYIVRLSDSSVVEGERPWFEVQVQTVAQELWSEMEHHLGYKPGKRTHISARRQLRIMARMLGAIDDNFDLLYDELNRYQEEQEYDDGDDLSAGNLAPVLGEFGIACAQRDINNILKFLYSRGVETIHQMRTLATPRRLAIIRSTYLATTGRLPSGLEVLATLAALHGAPDEEGEVGRIRSQIEFRGAWDAIRQEFHDG
jgi:putative GTP pyrophosphokinase